MNKWIFLMVLTFLASIGISPIYGQTKDQPSGASSTEMKKESGEAAGSQASGMKSESEKYQMKVREELNELKLKAKEYRAKAKDLDEKAKAEVKEEMRAFHQKIKGAEKKLKSIKSASGEAWEKTKSELDSAVDGVKAAYKKIAAHFEKA